VVKETVKTGGEVAKEKTEKYQDGEYTIENKAVAT
jgi:hypothetical protein